MPPIDLSPSDLIGLTADEATALQDTNADALLAMHGDTKPATAGEETAAPSESGNASTSEAGDGGNASTETTTENPGEGEANLSAEQLQAALEEAEKISHARASRRDP